MDRHEICPAPDLKCQFGDDLNCPACAGEPIEERCCCGSFFFDPGEDGTPDCPVHPAKGASPDRASHPK